MFIEMAGMKGQQVLPVQLSSVGGGSNFSLVRVEQPSLLQSSDEEHR